MRVTPAGLELIKTYEGLRLLAYQDSVGIWTIGYGHTSAAGAPAVRPGLRISRAEALDIFKRDVETFANSLRPMFRTPLSDNQFSALVSFAYNVGTGQFRGSSVFKAVSTGDYEAVPRRLALWNRAKGRVLSGLVKRRAAEGMLWLKDERNMTLFTASLPTPTESEIDEIIETRGLIDVPAGKALAQSSTIWASIGGVASTIGTAISGMFTSAKEHVSEVQQYWYLIPEGKMLMVVGAAAAVGCFVWIVRERKKKADEDGI